MKAIVDYMSGKKQEFERADIQINAGRDCVIVIDKSNPCRSEIIAIIPLEGLRVVYLEGRDE